jgi:glycosyltransferase involved in cell wall biosynthesis
MKKVLYVSKSVTPPWTDGSKNLVRDLANNVKTVMPMVMVGDSLLQDELASHVLRESIYGVSASSFSQGTHANARALWRLLMRAPEDLRHYVFAPNAKSSSAAKWMKRLRPRIPVVQTIASAPATWDPSLFFGDRVVVQSKSSQAKLAALNIASTMIWPCAKAPESVEEGVVEKLRKENYLDNEPIALYAGDYEVSTGAATVAKAAPYLRSRGLQVVFACRKKTPRAAEAQKEIEAMHGPRDAFHFGELRSLTPLLHAASVLIFPVDNLWGKVDLPLVLLEALALGKPIVVAGGGPLEEIPTAVVVPKGEPDALFPAIMAAAKIAPETCLAAYKANFAPEVTAAAYDRLYQELLP